MHRKYFRDGMWNIIDYVSSIIITIVTTRILIEKIGNEGYGFYVFFTGLVGTFGLVDIGAGMAISKYLCEYIPEKRISDCNEIITIGIIFYSLLSILLTNTIWLFNKEIITFLGFNSQYFDQGILILKIVPLIIFFNLITTIPINILTAMEKWKTLSITNVFFKIISSIFLIIIIMHIHSFSKMMSVVFYMLFFVAVMKFITIIWLAKQNFKELKVTRPQKANVLIITRFLKYSFLQYLLSLFVGHLDKFIISKLFGLNILGIYTFCVQVFVALYGFTSNLFKAVFPKLSYLHGTLNFECLKKYFQKTILLAFGTNILAASVMLLSWDFVISIYLNHNFALETKNIITYFMIFLIIRSFEIAFYYFFNAIAKPEILVRNLLISAIITNSLYFILIPNIGVIGIVLSQVIASVFVYSYNLFLFYYKEKYFFGNGGNTE